MCRFIYKEYKLDVRGNNNINFYISKKLKDGYNRYPDKIIDYIPFFFEFI